MMNNSFCLSINYDSSSNKDNPSYIIQDNSNNKWQIFEKLLPDFVSNRYEKASKKIEEANLSFSHFKKISHLSFQKISQSIKQQNLELNVKNLYLSMRFCYLYQNDAHFIEQILSTFSQNLEILNLNLTGNYLSLYGLSQILKSISSLFQNLKVLNIEFSTNSSSYSHKNNLDGFLDIIRLSKLESLDLDLKQAYYFKEFFECLNTPIKFESQLKEISIDCSSTQQTCFFENFSPIFEKLPKLEYINLDFQNSSVSGLLTFLNALQKSQLQKIVLCLYKSYLGEPTPSQIMQLLFQSKYLKYIDINFRMTARQSSDCSDIFQYLSECINLEVLNLSLQNNDIENEQLIKFAEHFSKTPPNLRTVDLNLTNEYKNKRISQEYVNYLEYPILKINFLSKANISYTEGNAEKFSQRLKMYSNVVKSQIYQNIAFTKLVSQQMIFNPKFINQDLYF